MSLVYQCLAHKFQNDTESLEGEVVGEFVGSGLSGGASFSGVGPEGSGHEPEIVIPKILTQGR